MLRLTFPQHVLQEPLLYNLGKDFTVVPNIRGAEIGEERGWMDLELEGEDSEIERVVEYLREREVDVELQAPASG
ncbi:MAG: FeS-binding protein [Planctomycetes bacterium]|jgi:ABC-type methionine transport system ATPase subunit|nr:FeS-binding protein [Planctomycetota bacterium]